MRVMNRNLLHKVYSLLILSDTTILFLIQIFLANLVLAARSHNLNRIAALFGGEGKRLVIDYTIRERHNANRENIIDILHCT